MHNFVAISSEVASSPAWACSNQKCAIQLAGQVLPACPVDALGNELTVIGPLYVYSLTIL